MTENGEAAEGDFPPGTDEDAQIEAMMSASSVAWSQNQNSIGAFGQEQFRPRSYRPAFRPSLAQQAPSMPPPPYYVCFRCGQKGHFITHCPTNADPNFDKPKLKKSTGIPRAFLKTVAATGDNSGSGGFLVTPDGSIVVAVSNDQEWQKISTAASRPVIDPTTVPASLKCKICSNLLNDPVCCPACKQAFCEECIMKTGPTKDLSCLNCHAAFMSDQLVPSDTIKMEVEQFIASSQQNKRRAAADATVAGLTPPMPPLPMFPFMSGMPPFLPPFMPGLPIPIPQVPVAATITSNRPAVLDEPSSSRRYDDSTRQASSRRRSRSRSPSRTRRRSRSRSRSSSRSSRQTRRR